VARCSIENIKDIDPTRGFVLTDTGSDWDKFLGNMDYYGYTNTDGQWFILRLYDGELDDLGRWTEVYRYAKGDDDYPWNWFQKALLTYDYYDVVW